MALWFCQSHRQSKHTHNGTRQYQCFPSACSSKANYCWLRVIIDSRTLRICIIMRVIGCWWLVSGCGCALLRGYNNARPGAAHTVHSFINTSVEGGQVFTTSSPCIFPTGSTFQPITHFFCNPSIQNWVLLMLFHS